MTNNQPDYYCPDCCAPREPRDTVYGYEQLQSDQPVQRHYCAACGAELMTADTVAAHTGTAQKFHAYLAAIEAGRQPAKITARYTPGAPKDQRFRWWYVLPWWNAAAKQEAESAEWNSQP